MTIAPTTGEAFVQARNVPPTVAQLARQTCAVRLIDRRTGRPHFVNGRALVLFSNRPELASAELLRGRDASVWEVRIEKFSG